MQNRKQLSANLGLLVGGMSAVALLTSGCVAAGSTAGGGGAQAKSGGITIGVAFPNSLQRRWNFDAKYMTAAAEKNGDKVKIQYGDTTAELQNTQVENLLSQGIDVLVLGAADSKAAATLVARAKSQGVPVIAYDIGIPNAEVDYAVTRDNAQAGELQAKAALAASPSGNFAVVKGDSANDVAQQIGKSADSVLQAAGAGVKVVFDDWTQGWSPEVALANAENVLSKHNDDVNAFVVSNDGMATGVIQALRGRQLNGKVFVSGMDGEPAALKLIAQGDQTMTVFTKIQDEAAAAANAAHALATKGQLKYDTKVNNGRSDVPTSQVSSVAITKDNLCEFITKLAPSGWVQVTDVFPGKPSSCAG
jgi:D-xylose transport system substrate-binding protein